MDLAQTLLAQGLQINSTNRYKETLFLQAIDAYRETPEQWQLINLLLDRGADPNIRDAYGHGPLTTAALNMDTSLIALLLENGAEPNTERGFTDEESIYDWAVWDYEYRVFTNSQLETPSETVKESEDSWLCFLDQQAKRYGLRRPDHLVLLRSWGARSQSELDEPKEGQAVTSNG